MAETSSYKAPKHATKPAAGDTGYKAVSKSFKKSKKVIKEFHEFNESETSAYAPPKFSVKPFPGDKGYEMVRKNYKRFLWTWNDYANKEADLPKGEDAKAENSNEADNSSFNRYQGEISGMGMSNDFPGETVGYTGPLKHGNFMATDDYLDPDDEELKRLKSIDDFESEESEDDKEEE